MLLVRSFLTLQCAFSDFVMFFYRCKREYQHMDKISRLKHLKFGD
ncbi:hypothetical protein GPLA_1310 [Paraglaciecola polaris LMG 21857]|uniref:Uncharacterized protein n=1 Tax=Paraglaciecola polaris LMG 21857 TaxID=1129793 RepID=K6YHL5_9ALTE|nr:hypothetical protein GPLA_1310 [Paraglaciecola polaris LMG 21857]